MKTNEVLNRAADEIDVRGLWRGEVDDGPESDVGVCVVLAIRDVLDQSDRVQSSIPAQNAVAVYLGLPPELQALYAWNDSRESAAEVIEVLRAAAVIEAARESELAEVSA